jgi:hypothetical protein
MLAAVGREPAALKVLKELACLLFLGGSHALRRFPLKRDRSEMVFQRVAPGIETGKKNNQG